MSQTPAQNDLELIVVNSDKETLPESETFHVDAKHQPEADDVIYQPDNLRQHRDVD